MIFDLLAPCHFGMEAVLKRELGDLGLEITSVSDGRVCFKGDARDICLANIRLRSAERIMIILGEFEARSFEELFSQVGDIPFEDYLLADSNFPITKASSIDSVLASPRDIQSITKKAIVERLKTRYKTDWFTQEGSTYPIRVFIKNDMVGLYLDTTGVSLHKRGYKRRVSKAPISETLAASLLMLTPYKNGRILLDPFCGTGTIPIEAALLAANMAPGMNREFTAMDWDNLVDKRLWDDVKEEAKSLERKPEGDIFAYDIDPVMIGNAKANAAMAGVEGSIHFKDADVKNIGKDFYKFREEYGFIITNPPYGERLSEADLKPLYGALGDLFKLLPTWSAYMITSYSGACMDFGKKAAKNRKVYNGMKKSYFYQFPGPKPGKQ